LPLFLSQGSNRQRRGPFDNSITGNITVHEDRLNNLLQLFAHTENSKWFSTMFVIAFEVNIAAEQKQA